MDRQRTYNVVQLHKILEKSLETIVNHMNKTDMEWLQLCSLVNKNSNMASEESFHFKVEDQQEINNIPIFVNVKADLNECEVEEFDSD